MKTDDSILLVHGHDAESAGFFKRHVHCGNRQIGASLFMIRHHFPVIHIINMVAAENQHVFRFVALDVPQVLVNRVCRPFVPVRAMRSGIRRQDFDFAAAPDKIPRVAFFQMIHERTWPILRQYADHIDFCVHDITQRKINDPVNAAKRHGGLSARTGKNREPTSLPSCKNHCKRISHTSLLR